MRPLHHRDSRDTRHETRDTRHEKEPVCSSRVSCLVSSPRAGGGIRTHIDRITSAAPFYVEPHRHECVWRELNPAPRGSQSRVQAVTPQTQRRGWESNPQGLAAHSRSRRGPSPTRVARPSVVPGGIEPPISSVSGRRLGHSTTGLSVPRPGVEPGTSRSKRGMMSVSPPGHVSGR